MPNPLTGEFNVAVEVSVEGVDRVLAAQHQQGRYLHSTRFRVPAESPEDTDGGSGIRGIAEVQTSAPTVTFPPDGGARVTAHYQLMVHMKPFTTSAEIAEFIHGELEVSADAQRVVSEMGEHIRIDLDADDVEVTFTPDPEFPLPTDQRRAVDEAIDDFMRRGFEPLNQRIHFPDTGEFAVRHWRFKTLPSGPAAALLLNLDDVEPAAAHVDDFDTVLLEEPDDFAFAVGSEFLTSKLHDMIRDALEEHVHGLRVTVPRRFRDCKYTIEIELDELVVEARSGRIEIEIGGRAHGNLRTCFDYGFRIRQGFALEPSRDGETVRLEAAGDLDLSVSGFLAGIVQRRIRGRARNARDRIIREAQPVLEEIFASFESFLEELDLDAFDLTYRDVDVSPAGVVVRGRFRVDWSDVFALYEKRVLPADPPTRPEPELELDAFRSWIPGGTVQRYRWLYASDRFVEHEIIEEHRFITRIAQRLLLTSGCVWTPCRWCLEVRGTQGRSRDGGPREVVGWHCSVIGGGIVDLPPVPGLGDLMLPLPFVDAAGDVVGHVDLVDPRGGTTGGGTTGGDSTTTGDTAGGDTTGTRSRRRSGNLVVHFPGDTLDDVSVLRAQVTQRTDSAKRVFGLVVMEPGAAQQRTRLQDELDDSPRLAWAEDFDGNWARAFEVSDRPATRLLDARGSLAWRRDGRLEEMELKAALDEHLRTVGPMRFLDLDLTVDVGDPMPDFLFDYADGQEMALRTLRGDPVMLSFWSSWSEASLAELRDLRGLHQEFANDGLVVLAINDGEDPQKARASFAAAGAPFQFVPDPERRISRLLGVRAWPTTLLIDDRQVVRRIQFGRTPAEAAFDTSVRGCTARRTATAARRPRRASKDRPWRGRPGAAPPG